MEQKYFFTIKQTLRNLPSELAGWISFLSSTHLCILECDWVEISVNPKSIETLFYTHQIEEKLICNWTWKLTELIKG